MEPVTCACLAWRRVKSPELFVEYRVKLRCGETQWVAWRRFRQFAKLRNRLAARIPAARKPLPGKHLHRHTVDPDELKKRAPALAEWLTGVIEADGAMAEMAVLEFIGLAAALPTTARPPVHVSMLPQIAETGDIMLFRTKATVPMLQRAVTRSDWDHVGILFRSFLVCFLMYSNLKHSRYSPPHIPVPPLL